MKCLEKRPSRRFQTTAEVLTQILPQVACTRTGLGFTLPAVDVMGWWRSLSRNVRLGIAGALVALLSIWLFSGEGSGPDDLHTVTVEITDGTADVYADGTRVGTTPYRMRGRIGESIRLELRRAGYRDQPIQFDVSERKSYSYAMQKLSSY